MSAFFHVLKTPPPRDVVHKDDRELNGPALYFRKQCFQPGTTFQIESTLPFVHERAHELHGMRRCVFVNVVKR